MDAIHALGEIRGLLGRAVRLQDMHPPVVEPHAVFVPKQVVVVGHAAFVRPVHLHRHLPPHGIVKPVRGVVEPVHQELVHQGLPALFDINNI